MDDWCKLDRLGERLLLLLLWLRFIFKLGLQGFNLCLFFLSSTHFVLFIFECSKKEGCALHNGKFRAPNTTDLRLTRLAKQWLLCMTTAKGWELKLVVWDTDDRGVGYQRQAYISCLDACASLFMLLITVKAAIVLLINLKHIQVVP